MINPMIKILFVCTANRFRSPLAEAYFNCSAAKKGDEQDFHAVSAGTWTENGYPATSDAQRLARLQGLDIEKHQSREISGKILEGSDLVLVMEAGHKEAIVHEFPFVTNRIFLLSETFLGIPFDVPDPYLTEEPPSRVAKEIFEMIDKGYDQILNLARQSNTMDRQD